jgi:hypothetical protein
MLILSNVQVVVGQNEVVHIGEVELSGSVLEMDIGVGSSLSSRVSEVNIVPSSQILFVGNSLPLVFISISVQIAIRIGREGQDIVSFLVTNPEGEGSVTQVFEVFVIGDV